MPIVLDQSPGLAARTRSSDRAPFPSGPARGPAGSPPQTAQPEVAQTAERPRAIPRHRARFACRPADDRLGEGTRYHGAPSASPSGHSHDCRGLWRISSLVCRDAAGAFGRGTSRGVPRPLRKARGCSRSGVCSYKRSARRGFRPPRRRPPLLHRGARAAPGRGGNRLPGALRAGRCACSGGGCRAERDGCAPVALWRCHQRRIAGQRPRSAFAHRCAPRLVILLHPEPVPFLVSAAS